MIKCMIYVLFITLNLEFNLSASEQTSNDLSSSELHPRIEKLQQICVNNIHTILLPEIAKNEFYTLDKIEQSVPKNLIIGLLFQGLTRFRIPLNPRLIFYVSTLDWSGMNLHINLHELNILQNCEFLTDLNVSGNQLGQGISSLGNLSQLQKLNLRNNQLRENVQYISGLTGLEVLDVSKNELRHYVWGISNLKMLKVLNIGENHLGQDIQYICHLRKLRDLDLYRNNLHGHTQCLNSLTKLKVLNLRGNQLTDEEKKISQELISKGTLIQF